MLEGNQINELVDLFDKRGVQLYHSCQFIDFLSYRELGGIPSRKKLSDEKKLFTHFETDGEDQNNGVWDKVFVNLHDFGEIFENGNGVPTVYGPIHCIIRPEALKEADDVGLALRSAGSPGFDRDKEALDSVDEIDRIFWRPSNTNKDERRKIKSIIKLKKEFKKDYVSNPEISMTIKEGLLSLDYVSEVKVDPYYFAGDRLINHIASTNTNNHHRLNGKNRKYGSKQKIIIDDITQLLLVTELSLDEFIDHPGNATETKMWAVALKEKGMEAQWRRYIHYLREGTLLPVSKMVKSDWGLYKCIQCEEMVMGYEKENHVKNVHGGKSVEWKRIKR